MTYDEFLTYHIAVNHGLLDSEAPYDMQYDELQKVYKAFKSSGFDNNARNLYECLEDYMNKLGAEAQKK